MTLTIVIASYNHEIFIEETLDAIKAFFDEPNYEVIIIDDGSTDKSYSIISNYVEQRNIKNISLITQQNSGLINVLNRSIELAKGEFIYFSGSDDLPNASGLKQLLTNICNHNYYFAIGNATCINEKSKVIKSSVYTKRHKKFLDKKYDVFLDIIENYTQPILIQSTIFNRGFLKSIGGFNKKFKVDDYPLFIQLMQVTKQYALCESIYTSAYRLHSQNITKNYTNHLRNIFQIHESLLDGIDRRIIIDVNNFFAVSYLLPVIFKNVDISAYKSLNKAFSNQSKLSLIKTCIEYLIKRYFK